MKLVRRTSMLVLLIFAKGLGNSVVGVWGKVNIRCNGTPRRSAQWIWAKDGGFAMIASACLGAVRQKLTMHKWTLRDSSANNRT